MKEDSSEYEREVLWWQNVATMLRQTTECLDGSDSTNGLSEEEILIESRMLKVISGFVAKWQTTQDTDAAIAHVRAGFDLSEADAGRRFDSRLVDALEILVQESWRF